MTREQYLELEENLKQAGYRRYNRSVTNETYYFCKGFEYVKDKDGDSSPSYQIVFSVWDHSTFAQIPDYDSFGVAVLSALCHSERSEDVLLRDSEKSVNINLKI